jgi:hypothetical protein
MQGLCVVLRRTLGSYLRDALYVVACFLLGSSSSLSFLCLVVFAVFFYNQFIVW